MSVCPNCEWGMWTNSIEKFVFKKYTDESGQIQFMEYNDIPSADGNLDEINRPSRKSLKNASDDNLLFVFRTCHNHIYVNDGLQKQPAFFELLKVIFCKIEDERNIPNPLQFYTTSEERSNPDGQLTVKKRISQIFERVKKRHGKIFDANEEIKLTPRSLAYIVSELQPYSLLNTNIDIKGKAYEEIVGANLRGDRGEFFTPRNVMKMVVDMINPKMNERVLDPRRGAGQLIMRIFVVSRNYSSGLGVIRALGASGHEVELIESVKQKGSSYIAAGSRYLRRTVEVYTPSIQESSGEELIEALIEERRKEPDEECVLFPVDDFSCTIIYSNCERLTEEGFLMPHTSEGAPCGLTELMNKRFQSEAASAAGLAVPRETVIPLDGEIEIPEGVVYPCFVKPMKSVAGRKLEMGVFYDRDHLMRHLVKMKDAFSDRSVLVQEYLHIDSEYDVSGVCLDDRVIIPGVLVKRQTSLYERGVTVTGVMRSPEILGDALPAIRDMLASMHYTGVFDMDLSLCGDTLYFGEINFRSGGTNYAFCLSGANLPAVFVDEAAYGRHDPADESMDRFDCTFVYEKVAWEDHIHGFMTKQALERALDGADFRLLDDPADPEPGRRFAKRIRLSMLKQRAKKMLGKGDSDPMKRDTAEKKKAVIIGKNYSNVLTMERDLGEAGFDVDTLMIMKRKPRRWQPLDTVEPARSSRYVRRFEMCTGDADVVKRLDALAPEHGRAMLVPTDDYTAEIADRNAAALEEHFHVPSAGAPCGVAGLMDKSRQKELASEAGLETLGGVTVGPGGEVPEGIHYPCFVKPNVTVRGKKNSMRLCRDRGELIAALSGLTDGEVLVEDYADIKDEYSLLGFSTPDGVVCPCVMKALDRGHRQRRGVAITGVTVDTEPFADIIEKCGSILMKVRYTGLFDVDLIETADGTVYFTEINFRSGASARVCTAAGTNMPEMMAEYFFSGKRPEAGGKAVEAGMKFASEKLMLEEYMHGDISRARARGLADGADVCFIRDGADPAPYRRFMRTARTASLLKPIYILRDRSKPRG
jgi:predicted ATP-grasp superfamily ATP-dependent carboligase